MVGQDAREMPNVVRRRQGEGMPVVFVHPLGADLRLWDEVAPALAGESVAPDLPGAGKTPLPEGGLTVEDQLAAIAAVAPERPFVLVGCAVGSMLAVRFAALWPERVRGLFLSNPGIRIVGAAAQALTDRAATVRREGMAALLPDAVSRAFDGQPEALCRSYSQRFAEQDAEGYAQSCLAAANLDVSGDLARLRCPILLLRGGRDLLFPAAHAEEIQRLRPDATLQVIEDGAHFLPYQRPQEFAERLNGFISILA